MRTYKIKPEYFEKWGSTVNSETIVTHDEAVMLAKNWDMSLDDLLDQLDEVGESIEGEL